MNMIAGLLIFYLDEETAFWGLVAILEHIMPTGVLYVSGDNISASWAFEEALPIFSFLNSAVRQRVIKKLSFKKLKCIFLRS